MAPLQPIDRNISPDWPTLAEVVRTVAGNWDDGATTEEEAMKMEIGRSVRTTDGLFRFNEHHVEDREVFDVMRWNRRVQRRAHRFYQTGTHAGS